MRMDYHHYSEETCDVVLEVEGVYFPVHQQVMLDLSPTFFSDLFSKGPTESLVYMVHNVASYIMRPIIQYAYSRQITITQRNVKDLLAAAEYLSVSDIVQLCKEFLEKQHCEEDRCETMELPTQFCPDLPPWERNLLYELGVFSPGAFEPNASPSSAFDPDATPSSAFEPNASPPSAFDANTSPLSTFEPNASLTSSFETNATPPTEKDRCEMTELPTTQFCPDFLSLVYELGLCPPDALETNTSPSSAFERNASPPSVFDPNASAVEPNVSPPSAVDSNVSPPSAFDPNATPPTEEDRCETTELPTTQFCPDLLSSERSLLYELGVFPQGALEPNATPPTAFDPNDTPPRTFEPNASPHSAFDPNASRPSVFEQNPSPPSVYVPATNSPSAYGPFAHAPSAAPDTTGQFINAPYAHSPLFYCRSDRRQKCFVSYPCQTPYSHPSVRSRAQAWHIA